MRLVKIEWVDSRQPIPAWLLLDDLADVPGPGKCVSVGFLLRDDDDVKILAPNVSELHSEANAQASGVMVIPSCSVTSIRDL